MKGGRGGSWRVVRGGEGGEYGGYGETERDREWGGASSSSSLSASLIGRDLFPRVEGGEGGRSGGGVLEGAVGRESNGS